MKDEKATAQAGDGEAVRKVKPPPIGIPQELWDSWAITETFKPGPNGEPSPEEQAAVDEQATKIRAFRAAERKPAEDAERAAVAAKNERAEKRRSDQVAFKKQFEQLVADVAELKKAGA